MKSTLVRQDSDKLADVVVRGMQEKKASDIVVLNLKELKNAVADYFVICSASSDTQIEAIARSVEEEVEKLTGQNPWQTEGRMNREWVLLDYVDVVVHVFLRDRRKFYSLEELWGDAQITYVEEDETSAAVK
ncbi:ribosome silencing factor [Hymenobacter rubripertinctus]|uniref:Ribosomal silencing factor RsfS n=1 Tax=Hymenobacter rubripertinctus TaxID=2029981 RepID=A0A418R2S5_9BACT|nr:ribosome silencing factor [Hymenobacter rubripertinctus]RIY11747.1 ribosome silencing factor [Hymenobacter rubripertinctus]